MENLLNIKKNKPLLLCFYTVSFLTIFTCKDKTNNAVRLLSVPTSGVSSSEPSIHASNYGMVYLSWIEKDDKSNNFLKFSQLKENSWTSPKTIASGSDWFINWADFPSITTFGETNMVAHYLQKSADETYAYDVKFIQSVNNGESWNDSFKPHRDSTNTEHGFVSKISISKNRFFSVWLDGRQNAYAERDSTIKKQMTLRGAIINKSGDIEKEYLLDKRVCDCCQTDAAITNQGPIVVYRNRSEDEIRDIYYTRQIYGIWTEPKPIFNDNWKIAGCPVNGPTISAKGSQVVVSWFTLDDTIPKVNLAFSDNNGSSFNDPIVISQNNTIGRLDVELLNDGSAILSSVYSHEGESKIVLHHIKPNGEVSIPFTVAETTKSRSSGFPRMAIKDDKVYLAWTNAETNLRVKSAEILISELTK